VLSLSKYKARQGEAIRQSTEKQGEWLLNKLSFTSKSIEIGVNFKFWKDGYLPVYGF
jgi:hypothetical protein